MQNREIIAAHCKKRPQNQVNDSSAVCGLVINSFIMTPAVML